MLLVRFVIGESDLPIAAMMLLARAERLSGGLALADDCAFAAFASSIGYGLPPAGGEETLFAAVGAKEGDAAVAAAFA